MSLPINPLTPGEELGAKETADHHRYWVRLIIGVDLFVNVIFNGRPGETISSRSARAALEGKRWGIILCKFLNLFERNHSALATEGDLERARLIEGTEKATGLLPDEK